MAELDGGQDPDTFARTHGADQVQEWLDGAKPFREYQIDRIISQHDVETREGKLAASTELVSVLAQLTSQIERDEYVRYASQRLGVLERSLAAEVREKQGIGSIKHVHTRRNVKTCVPCKLRQAMSFGKGNYPVPRCANRSTKGSSEQGITAP